MSEGVEEEDEEACERAELNWRQGTSSHPQLAVSTPLEGGAAYTVEEESDEEEGGRRKRRREVEMGERDVVFSSTQ